MRIELREMSSFLLLCKFVVLLLPTVFYTASADVFYIIPTTSSPCPVEFDGIPCLTFQQYALNPSRSPNVTLIIEPTTYSHSQRLTIANGYNFTMSSTNATIMCTSTSGNFHLNSFDNIHISGITFRGCHNAITLTRVSRGVITNCNFEGNRATNGRYSAGPCIFLQYSTSVIVNTSEFRNNRASYHGGAIFAQFGSRVTVYSSIFSDNAVIHETGGAIFGRENSDVIVYNCTFIQNTARLGGGAILTDRQFGVTNSVFINNRVRAGNGGAVSISGRVILPVVGCTFINNVATGSGGAIFKTRSSEVLTIDRSRFHLNSAGSFGGAVYVNSRSSIKVISSSFINNTAVRQGGGAIYSNGRYANIIIFSSTFSYNSASYCSVLDIDEFDHFSVNLTNSVFTYNNATGQTIGGGVACIRNASINIVNSAFKHNYANYHAGAFYIDESVVRVDGSVFINNSAAEDGGVFYTYVHASDYIIRRSQFSDNAAGDDGGVMFIGRLNSLVSIDESIFDFNSAYDRGGVIALIASSMYMEINRTNIYNNTAQFGGIISACNSEITFEEDILTAYVDPLLSFCTLYGGDIRYFNLTIPEPEPITTAAPQTTTVPPTTTTPPTTTIGPPTTTVAPPTTTIAPPTTTAPPITTDTPAGITTASSPTAVQQTTTLASESPATSVPPLTSDDVTTIVETTRAPAPVTTVDDTSPTTSTKMEGINTDKSTTTADIAVPTTTLNIETESPVEGGDDIVPIQIITKSEVTIIMVLSTVSFAVSLVAILGMCMLGFLFFSYTRKPKSKPVAHEMDEYDNFTTKNEFTVIN